MNIEDYNILSNYKRDYDQFIRPNENLQNAVDAQIDTPAVTWAIISTVIDILGDQANCWNYQIQGENNHVSVWPTEASINKGIISELEDAAKRNLGIHGYSILELYNIENGPDEETSQNGRPLTAISDDVSLICNCWLDYTTKLGLIRSGNFIKNEAYKDSARDLELWRFGNDFDRTQLKDGEMLIHMLKM
ncbi:hypothetical protein SPOG_05750 [Schizosaccharomyces cryophilus OY26]|uniref:Uncharacterized protein n=1 Tax=Schizosaccharomyces cryophilus (strain OY26 / ATCC MYA-4695 / CBS 11777 / NBRC 106824 / NRRL Y48691) TaxID=653667 RepID=S9VZK3_SCHCR|nr:uncharacterized protein SPOG_05750 [Schizosaccharomyces cryophilus OY26]EPY51634.1 hypothetical protein SPOG_05750 [Schizosaccharomyces cryophilus OY26]